MSALTEQESNWISGLCSRLHLIQSDIASFPPEKRREYLNEEISRGLKEVPVSSRKRYLEALLLRFPVAGQTVRQPTSAPVPASTAPPPETFEQVFEKFLAGVQALSKDERDRVALRLNEAGVVFTVREAGGLEVPPETAAAFGLPPDEQPRPEAVVKLCLLLLETLQRMDQAALATLRELAPRSALLKRREDLRAAAGQFLARKDEALEPQLRMVSSLIGALLAAMLGGGKDFGRDFVGRLSPSAIEDVIAGEGGGSIFGRNKKERCWDKYSLLAKDYETAEIVDRRIRDCLAAFIERKVLGR